MAESTQELLAPIESKLESVGFKKKFAFEVALQYEPLRVIMERYGVTINQLRDLRHHKPFVVAVRQYQRDIAEKGLTFKLKAKLLSEDLIDTAYMMAKNPACPASVRTENIKNIVRWAELEPAKTGVGDVGSGDGGTQFNIQINLG